MSLTLSLREKIGVATLVAVALAAVFLLKVHQPLVKNVNDRRTQVAEAEAALEKDHKRLAREGDLATRESEVENREQAINGLTPGRHAAVAFVHLLSRVEQQAGVQIHSLKAGDRKAVGEWIQVTMDLEVDGTFASHILFQQNLQAVPLFINISRWKLDAGRAATASRANELASQGRPWEAEALLRQHPRVKGNYQFFVYFRSEGPGSEAETLGTRPATGRVDPFLDDRIDEFMGEVHKAYSRGGTTGLATPALESATQPPGLAVPEPPKVQSTPGGHVPPPAPAVKQPQLG